MKTWDTRGLDVEAHKPHIVSSTEAARVIVLHLPEGESLQEHMVHERAYVAGAGRRARDHRQRDPPPGVPACSRSSIPGSRTRCRRRPRPRLLLFLAPWPGDGHPGAMTLDDKAQARERARERAAD